MAGLSICVYGLNYNLKIVLVDDKLIWCTISQRTMQTIVVVVSSHDLILFLASFMNEKSAIEKGLESIPE
jgi:hypothetical protein